MHDSTFEHLSSEHHDLAREERLARSEEKRWSVGSSIFLMISVSAFLWIAIYFSAQQLF